MNSILKKKTMSSFDEFAQDALRAVELPSIVGGIETSDDFDLPFDEREKNKRRDEDQSRLAPKK